MKKYATFFGGSYNITDTPEYLDSVKIGEFLAKKKYIIKNGGYRGLMEAVFKGANESSGKVIGYTCELFKSTKGNDYLSETIVCKNIFERLNYLISELSVFIIQKGSFGTMSELFLLLDITRETKVKPDIFIIGEMWNDIFNQIMQHVNVGYMKHIHFCKDYKEFEIMFDFIITLKDNN
jgi:hypothetical protein